MLDPNTKIHGYNSIKCDNKYTVFFELCYNKKDLLKELIGKIKYVLHPTYKVNECTVTDYPFSLTRNAWGLFVVKIEITWKKWLNIPDTKLEHMLEYNEGGAKQNFVLSFNKKDFKNFYGTSFLTKYMKKESVVKDPNGCIVRRDKRQNIANLRTASVAVRYSHTNNRR